MISITGIEYGASLKSRETVGKIGKGMDVKVKLKRLKYVRLLVQRCSVTIDSP